MNDKIVIQSVTEGRSSIGAVTQTWATFATVWAEVDQASGSELFTSEMTIYNDIKTFEVYYNHGQDITAKMRIVYRSENYQITSISNKDRLKTLIVAIRYDDD